MKEKYNRWNLAQRASLAQTCAASLFNTFVEPANCGLNWTPESMKPLLKSHVRTQCLLAGINPKYHDNTVKIAVEFYEQFLEKAMERLWAARCSNC